MVVMVLVVLITGDIKTGSAPGCRGGATAVAGTADGDRHGGGT